MHFSGSTNPQRKQVDPNDRPARLRVGLVLANAKPLVNDSRFATRNRRRARTCNVPR